MSDAPDSLLPVHVLAPAAMAVGAVVTLSEWAAIENELWALLLVFGAPAVTMCAATLAFSRKKRARAWLTMGIGALVHVAVIAVMTAATTSRSAWIENGVVSIIVVVVTMGFAAAMASPMLIAASHYAERTYLARGDQLLGVAGLWLFMLQALGAMVARERYEVFCSLMALALVPVVVSFVRGRRRQAWCERIERGEVPGLRLRAWDRRDIDHDIPSIDDKPHGDLAIVERVETGSLPYRSGVVGVPVVMMRTEIELGA